jgi:Pin2-interacting protein X1
MGLGSSRFRLEVHSETGVGEETQRVGLSKFSSLTSSSFLAATSSLSSQVALSTDEDKMEDTRIARITEVHSESKETKKRVKKKISNSGLKQDNGDDQLKGGVLDHNGKGKVKKSEERGWVINEEEDKMRKEKKNQKKLKRGLEESQTATNLAEEQEVDSGIEKASRKKEKRKKKAEKSSLLADEGGKRRSNNRHRAVETHR